MSSATPSGTRSRRTRPVAPHAAGRDHALTTELDRGPLADDQLVGLERVHTAGKRDELAAGGATRR